MNPNPMPTMHTVQHTVMMSGSMMTMSALAAMCVVMIAGMAVYETVKLVARRYMLPACCRTARSLFARNH